jgi:heme-degrading monooxygenase HmoA
MAFVVQDTFKAKPGKAQALADRFALGAPHLRGGGVLGHRILIDHVADYWTVMIESTVEDLDAYFEFPDSEEFRAAMDGYMDLVDGGNRRIFRVTYQD